MKKQRNKNIEKNKNQTFQILNSTQKADVKLLKITKTQETEPRTPASLTPELQLEDLASFVRAENA